MTKKVNILLMGIMLTITLGCGGGGGGYQGDGAADLGSGSYGASENSQDSSSDSTNINSPPAFTNLPAMLEVRENQTTVTTITATDADGDALTIFRRWYGCGFTFHRGINRSADFPCCSKL